MHNMATMQHLHWHIVTTPFADTYTVLLAFHLLRLALSVSQLKPRLYILPICTCKHNAQHSNHAALAWEHGHATLCFHIPSPFGISLIKTSTVCSTVEATVYYYTKLYLQTQCTTWQPCSTCMGTRSRHPLLTYIKPLSIDYCQH